jgi:hypothetical protein
LSSFGAEAWKRSVKASLIAFHSSELNERAINNEVRCETEMTVDYRQAGTTTDWKFA